jgi:mono/diheme cytochrome c family protein
MFEQPNIRHFQAVMPAMPPNTIPVKDTFEPVPSKEQAQKLSNPVASTLGNIAKGKVYYGYYCVFCHGDKGDGFGPVGYSYVPVPADLRNQKIRSMADGQVLNSMLTGTGHAPMLQRIIPSEYWWYIVLYVRQLEIEPQAAADSNNLPE